MILDGVPRRGQRLHSRRIPEPIDFCPFSPLMEKVLAVGAATTRLRALKTGPEQAEPAQATVAPPTGNAVCAVLFLEMIDFSRKSVADQLVLRERFNGRVARALEQVPLLDRMVLETGDGVAITFLGGAQAALHVALRFAHSLQPASGSSDPLQVRGGINIGPVRLTHDVNGQALVLGDGINVAQRLLGFGAPGQFLVSRAYHEALCERSPAYKGLFLYQGSRTDTHVREHEVYVLDPNAVARDEVPPPVAASAREPAPATPVHAPRPGRRRLALGAAALSATLLAAAVLVRLLPGDAGTPAQLRPDAGAAALERPLVLRHTPLLPAPAAQPSGVQSDAVVAAAPDASADTGEPTAVSPPAATVPAFEAPQARTASRHAGSRRTSPPQRAHTQAAAGRAPATPGPATALPEGSAAVRSAKAEPVPHAEQPSADVSKAPPVLSPPPPASPKKAATALVLFAISPWGEVFVDGRSMGVSPPLKELELAQGRHRIVVRNSEFKSFDEEIELGSNQTLRIKHKFVRR